MVIKSAVLEALNKQIQHEQTNAHIYQAVELYFEALNLRGIAGFMAQQASDERGHAAKFIEHVIDRGGKVELRTIAAPKGEFANPLAAAKLVLETERGTTALLYKLNELAAKEGDYALQTLLQWFITEQVEEEKVAEELVMLLEQFHAHPGQLFMLDHRWPKMAKGES